ncbi:MAG: methyl-accepting chemotaxis protein [Mariprofundaceae bacterium]|nr:methyl-accepting chemotaxis protein [Mariprofundaceae bacterium]
MAQVETQKSRWLSIFGSRSVKQKILLSGIALAILPVLASNFFLASRATKDGSTMATIQVKALLSAVRDTKKTQIEDFYNGVKSNLMSLAGSSGILSASKTFMDGIADYEMEPLPSNTMTNIRERLRQYYSTDFAAEYARKNPGAKTLDTDSMVDQLDNTAVWMQYQYIAKNPNPLGQKNRLSRPLSDDALYHDVHSNEHENLRYMVDNFNYYDVFIVDIASDRIIYSDFKELDFGTRLIGGYLENSGIAKLYAKMKKAGNGAGFMAQPFSQYLPSYNALASFVAAPIIDEGGQLIAVLMVQLSDTAISRVLTNNNQWQDIGLGKTGEAYLVAENGILVSNIRPIIENKETFIEDAKRAGINEQEITQMNSSGSAFGVLSFESESKRLALSTDSGVREDMNYLNQSVLSAYGLVTVYGLKWIILAQMNTEEALAPVTALEDSLQKASWTVAILVLIAALGLALVFARILTTPLSSIEASVRRLAAGDFTARCNMNTGDEFQSLGDAIDHLVSERADFLSSEEASELLNEHIIQVLDAVAELSQRNLTVNVPVTEDIIGPVADALNLMTEETSEVLKEVREVAQYVDQSSNRLEQLASDVNTLAESESAGVQNMAEKLMQESKTQTTIASIAETSNTTAQLASKRVQEARETVGKTASGMHDIREIIHETEKRIKRLGERSQEISSITDIINTIAERTHVLSINASMQAAAAGEAGKGFSVVAEEVQRLAESSRNATAQIATLVKNIQIETVDASETMARTIEQVVAGSQLADDAGKIMEESRDITAQLAEMVNNIALMAENQATAGKALREDAEDLRNTTEQTAKKIIEQNAETEKLANYSTQLRDSVGSFKLD